MDTKEKKLTVLQELGRLNEAGLKEILGRLNPEFNERTVRRWLAEMIKQGQIEKIGNRRASKYRILSKFSPQKILQGNFQENSLATIAFVRKPIYERPPVAYSEELLNSYIPNQIFYLPEPTRDKLYKEGKRAQKEDPAGTYAQAIFNRLLIDLSYNSSRLEGNTYSLLDTKKLLIEGKSAEGKLDEETTMILNHKEAIRYLVDQAPYLTISLKTLYTLHYLLSDGLVEPALAGKIRDHGVRIGGSTYIPFENPKKLEGLLKQIADLASRIEDPYEQSFFLLVHVSYLQPFVDVNKRTARLAANIPLVKHNLVPLSFNDVEREDYTAAVLAIYELQDVRPLIDLYTFSYLRTCALYDSTVKALGFDEVRVRYRTERRAFLREIIVQRLHGPLLKEYIYSEAASRIKEKDRKDFIEDVLEDLDLIDESRIVGLGITSKDLKAWQADLIQKTE